MEGWVHYLRWSGLERPLWGRDIWGLNNMKELSLWRTKGGTFQMERTTRTERLKPGWSCWDSSYILKIWQLRLAVKLDVREGSQGWSQGFSLSYRVKGGAVGVIYWAREDSMEGRVLRILNPCTSGLRYLLVTQVTIGLALGFMRLQCRPEIPVWESSEGIIVRVQSWISKRGQDEMGRWRCRHDVPIRKRRQSLCV